MERKEKTPAMPTFIYIAWILHNHVVILRGSTWKLAIKRQHKYNKWWQQYCHTKDLQINKWISLTFQRSQTNRVFQLFRSQCILFASTLSTCGKTVSCLHTFYCTKKCDIELSGNFFLLIFGLYFQVMTNIRTFDEGCLVQSLKVLRNLSRTWKP